jgi:hypothetical protein
MITPHAYAGTGGVRVSATRNEVGTGCTSDTAVAPASGTSVAHGTGDDTNTPFDRRILLHAKRVPSHWTRLGAVVDTSSVDSG